ncbi:FAD-dependent monooxygenase [Streptomyces sp. NPDC057137]|uniref:FAD-dependent monooxygenase n=1 Tax=Streptomyces sp. NPDC057137 TaxID=3346030 RepID=UPI0036354710
MARLGHLTTLNTDVLVVGASPAGLALSLMLLRSGVRVALVEHSTAVHDESDGEILQPAGQRILDQLGVLDGSRLRGGRTLHGFQVLERGRKLHDSDYRRLDAPYNRLLALPQRHLREELLASVARLPGFEHLPGYAVTSLSVRDGRCTGAEATRLGTLRTRIRASVVVAADGRLSRTRARAGIDAGRDEASVRDTVWFTPPAPGRPTRQVRVYRAGDGALLIHDTFPDRLRIGWTLPRGGWNDRASRGVAAVRRELAGIVPELADVLEEHLVSVEDVVPRAGFTALASAWVRDGLALIGDAAHTHGPLSVQGATLALEDAVVLHPVLLDALAAGDVGRARLAAYEQMRRPVAEALARSRSGRARAGLGGGGQAASLLRAVTAGVVNRTPYGGRATRRIAYGSSPVHVRTETLTGPFAGRPAGGSPRAGGVDRLAS